MTRSKGSVWLPSHRRNRQGCSSIGADPAPGGTTARMAQPVERAIHVAYEKLYILLKGRRCDQAPIDILTNMSHRRISTVTTGIEARPHLETRNTQHNVLRGPQQNCAAPKLSTRICHNAAIRPRQSVMSDIVGTPDFASSGSRGGSADSRASYRFEGLALARWRFIRKASLAHSGLRWGIGKEGGHGVSLGHVDTDGTFGVARSRPSCSTASS
jgi:hypothetical protein